MCVCGVYTVIYDIQSSSRQVGLSTSAVVSTSAGGFPKSGGHGISPADMVNIWQMSPLFREFLYTSQVVEPGISMNLIFYHPRWLNLGFLPTVLDNSSKIPDRNPWKFDLHPEYFGLHLFGNTDY